MCSIERRLSSVYLCVCDLDFRPFNMFSSPDWGVLAAAFHPNGLNTSPANNSATTNLVSPPNSSNSSTSPANAVNTSGASNDAARFVQSNPDENTFLRNGFCSRQSAFSSPEKGILSPRQNSYVGVTGTCLFCLVDLISSSCL